VAVAVIHPAVAVAVIHPAVVAVVIRPVVVMHQADILKARKVDILKVVVMVLVVELEQEVGVLHEVVVVVVVEEDKDTSHTSMREKG